MYSVYVHAQLCELCCITCCILVSVHIPAGYGLVDSLSLKTSRNFYKADTRCDILLFECPKIPTRRFCVLLRKQEELNSWIFRLGKADLVVTLTSDRRPQTSLYRNKSGCPSFDSFVRILIFSDGAYYAPPFAHAPPTAAHFPVASPSYSELSLV